LERIFFKVVQPLGQPLFSSNDIKKGRIVNGHPFLLFLALVLTLDYYSKIMYTHPPGVDVESPFHTCTYLILTHVQVFRDVPNADMYLPLSLVCELVQLPLSTIIADTMLNQLRQQKDKLKKNHCGGDNLKRSVICVLGKKQPCIPSLNVVLVSVEFS
jgi:hypothetical protein